MKKHLYILLVCVVSLVLDSCEGRESKNLEAWQSKVSHFMGESIYQVGNRIPMITENGEEEVFVVNLVNEGGVMSGTDLCLANVKLGFGSDNNKVLVYTETGELQPNPNEEIHIWGWVGMNQEVDDLQMYTYPAPLVINDFDVNQSTISITGASGTTAVFQYDVGLIQLSDTMGHTWTKK